MSNNRGDLGKKSIPSKKKSDSYYKSCNYFTIAIISNTLYQLYLMNSIIRINDGTYKNKMNQLGENKIH